MIRGKILAWRTAFGAAMLAALAMALLVGCGGGKSDYSTKAAPGGSGSPQSPTAVAPHELPDAEKIDAILADDSRAASGDDATATDPQTRSAAAARKIIRNGEISLTVDAYEPAKAGIDRLMAECGGFIANTSVQHYAGQTSRAEITLRIPAEHFDRVLAGVGGLGTVTHEAISTDDITEQYFDVKSRLDNARRLEKRLLELLDARTDKLSEIIEVERELARVRETIEVFEGRLRLYDNLVGLSTLRLIIDVRQPYVPATQQTSESFGEEIGSAFSGSWSSFVGFLKDMAVGLARGSIQIVLVLLILACVWRFVIRRWWKHRRPSASPAPPAPPAN